MDFGEDNGGYGAEFMRMKHVWGEALAAKFLDSVDDGETPEEFVTSVRAELDAVHGAAPHLELPPLSEDEMRWQLEFFDSMVEEELERSAGA